MPARGAVSCMLNGGFKIQEQIYPVEFSPRGIFTPLNVHPVECGAYSTGALAYSTEVKTIPPGLDLLTLFLEW